MTRSAAGPRPTAGARRSSAAPRSSASSPGEEQLEPVDWDRWFEIFDRNQLALLYQQQQADGEDSTFHKLVSRS
jgi:hypothetical protein